MQQACKKVSCVALDGVHMQFGRKAPLEDTRKTVLDGVNLNVQEGEILCLLGPSGCGKSTIVNLIIGNEVPTQGEVRVMGQKAPYARARSRVGYMPQEDVLYEDITAKENLQFFGAMLGMEKREIERRSQEVLDFTRLTADCNRLVSSFSGGMKRRLSLAIALLHEPDLYVLDEPTVGLDPDHRRRIWAEFERLCAAGKTLLITTHVMDEAARCKRIAMLYGGHLIAEGSPEEVLELSHCDNLEDAFIALGGAEESGVGND